MLLFAESFQIPFYVAVIAAILALANETCRDWFVRLVWGPNLTLSFYDSKDKLIPIRGEDRIVNGESVDGETDAAYYIRVKVNNTKQRIAEKCRPYLARIDRKDTTYGSYKEVFSENLPLNWSYNTQSSTTEIPHAITKHFDVLHLIKDKYHFIPQFRRDSGKLLELTRTNRLFPRNGVYRFVVLVTADRVATRYLIFTVDMDQWPPVAEMVSTGKRSDLTLLTSS